MSIITKDAAAVVRALFPDHTSHGIESVGGESTSHWINVVCTCGFVMKISGQAWENFRTP